jgi:hypothetical protein
MLKGMCVYVCVCVRERGGGLVASRRSARGEREVLAMVSVV